MWFLGICRDRGIDESTFTRGMLVDLLKKKAGEIQQPFIHHEQSSNSKPELKGLRYKLNSFITSCLTTYLTRTIDWWLGVCCGHPDVVRQLAFCDITPVHGYASSLMNANVDSQIFYSCLVSTCCWLIAHWTHTSNQFKTDQPKSRRKPTHVLHSGEGQSVVCMVRCSEELGQNLAS